MKIWLVLFSVLVVACVPDAFAAPFADRTALKAAVDSCLAVDATGVACCDSGANCGAAGTDEMDKWDVSQVTDMSLLFKDKTQFNRDISHMDTSKVTRMDGMFWGAQAFNNGNKPIGDWNTAEVTDMSSMFRDATSFNQPIGNWTTSKVTEMGSMFRNAALFNQPIGNWNTSKVTEMGGLFLDAGRFNHPVGDWDTSKVTSMSTTLSAAAFNQPINDWDTSKVTDMSGMLSKATAFNQPINDWNTSKVTNMMGMFYYATSFNQPIDGWDTSQVTNMQYMFTAAAAFNQPIGEWNTSKVTNMGDMFIGASSWHAAYTNCGHDDSASVCLSSTSYASSNGINDGPPSAWVLTSGADASATQPNSIEFFASTDGTCTGTHGDLSSDNSLFRWGASSGSCSSYDSWSPPLPSTWPVKGKYLKFTCSATDVTFYQLCSEGCATSTCEDGGTAPKSEVMGKCMDQANAGYPDYKIYDFVGCDDAVTAEAAEDSGAGTLSYLASACAVTALLLLV